MTDVCPGCGGVADNGHDRCDPPNVYLCSKCVQPPKMAIINEGYRSYLEEKSLTDAHKARRAELVKEFMLAEIAADSDATIEQILTRAVNDADAFLKWEEEQ